MLDTSAFGTWRSVNLPGIRITVKDMLEALGQVAGIKALDKIQFKPDPAINNIVSSWPGRIDIVPALKLGFKVDHHFKDFINQFIQSAKVQP
jgi:nucleoside-diphosphate-sugar epimerase